MESIEAMIKDIQSMMCAYATGGRTDEQPTEYRELYIDLSIALEQHRYSNPNPYKTMEAFWNACGPTWADRRRLVSELYADVLFDIGRRNRKAYEPRNWRKANDTLSGNLDPVRRQWLKAKNFIQAIPPDFENSIKESISTVESCLKILLHEPSKTLGQLAKCTELDRDISRMISTAYGLTSNRDSVRHGGMGASELGQAEAEFFLDFCASVVLYIRAKLEARSRTPMEGEHEV